MIKKLNSIHFANQTFKFDCEFNTPPVPDNYFEKIWSDLSGFLNTIYKKGLEIEISFQDLYEKVETCCMLGYDRELHKELSSFYKKIIGVELEAIKLKSKEHLLEDFDNLWRLIFRERELLSEILVWFEKSYLLKKTRIKTIEKLILIELASLISNLKEVKTDLIEQIINEITKERKGEEINKTRLKNVIEMFIKVDMYKSLIEPQLLTVSDNFYKQESEQFKANFQLVEYLDHTDKRVHEEIKRCQEYLDSSSENKLVDQIEKIFISDNLQVILSSGFDDLIKTKNHTSLAKLFHFLEKVGKLDYLKKTWGYFIKSAGSEIMNEAELNLEKVLTFKRDLEKIWIDCFSKNNSLKTQMTYSLEDCINTKTNKVAELTSKQMDDILRNAHKISSDEKLIEDKLDDVLSIFRFLQARDIFEAFYTKRLIKRVLLGLSSSEDLEKKMIEKLKLECGTTFTRRAEEAMKDFEISKNLTKEFLASQSFKICPFNQVELNVNIFSTNSWPLKSTKINGFEDPFLGISDAFKKFYTSKFSGVVLSWQYETSTCEIIGYFGKEKLHFQVSYIQAVILMMFNNQKQFSYQQLKEIINIDDEDLKLHILSFLNSKEKIILKSTESSNLEANDVFTVNENFSSKLKMIKINLLQKKETKEEIDQTTNRVLQERQYLLDAAIVRIMKMRKTLQHNDLINDIFNDLKLPIALPEIKKRIESLIERDYMVRDKDEFTVYHYVA